jgi:hypothetical protein
MRGAQAKWAGSQDGTRLAVSGAYTTWESPMGSKARPKSRRASRACRSPATSLAPATMIAISAIPYQRTSSSGRVAMRGTCNRSIDARQ